MAHTNTKFVTDKFSSEQTAMESQQQRQTVTSAGVFNQEQHSSSSHSVYTTSTKGISTSTMHQASQVSVVLFLIAINQISYR